MAGPVSPAASSASAMSSELNYGQDHPHLTRSMFTRSLWITALAGVLYWVNAQEYPGPALRLSGTIVLIAVGYALVGWWMLRSSREGKLRVRDQMLEQANLQGAERVLDVGCGRGLLTIAAAQRLTSGRVIGIGTWDESQLSGYTAEAARENAKAAGVAEKLRFENGDLLKLAYPDAHFDVVLSFLAVHHLPEAEDRARVLREMYRVLKPGGKLVLHDLKYSKQYLPVLEACGAHSLSISPTSYLWAMPGATISAQKA